MKTTRVIHLVLTLCAFAPSVTAQHTDQHSAQHIDQHTDQHSAQHTSRNASRYTMRDFSIPGIFQYDFVSSINSLPYRLSVALPYGYSPADTIHYPVMYMLDGDPNLPLTALIQSNMTYDGEVPNMIIVGIGYQAPNFMGTIPYRTLDYTPTRVAGADSQMTANHHVKMVSGGAAGFLRVMTEEIMPFIGQSYKIGPGPSLAGHSFAGYLRLMYYSTGRSSFPVI